MTKRTTSHCFIISTNNTLHSDPNYEKLLFGTRKTGYPFLNSIDCIISIEQQYPALYYSYDYLLKTDDDIFLTPFFLYTFPKNSNEFIVGEGGYVWPQNNLTRDQIINISSIFGINHCRYPDTYCFNYGAAWYGSPDLINAVAKLTIKITVYIRILYKSDKC